MAAGRCRWGDSESPYWGHRFPDLGGGRCEQPQAFASSFCKAHILLWRNFKCDWQRFTNYDKEQNDD